jgi:hypothetical protein
MAGPQWRRSAGRVAVAAASSSPGPSSADSRVPARRHQARHSSRAATTKGVPKTASEIVMTSASGKVTGSSAVSSEPTQR